jgi:hypothetical protein
MPEQEQREDRRRQIADAGKEPEDGIDAERNLCAGDAERAVEDARPPPHHLQPAGVVYHVTNPPIPPL